MSINRNGKKQGQEIQEVLDTELRKFKYFVIKIIFPSYSQKSGIAVSVMWKVMWQAQEVQMHRNPSVNNQFPR